MKRSKKSRRQAALKGWRTRHKKWEEVTLALYGKPSHTESNLKYDDLSISQKREVRKIASNKKRYKETVTDFQGEAVEVRSGYDGRGDNSYTLVVHMFRRKGESDQDLSNRIEKMATQGKFDAAGKKFKVNDLRWATFHNNFSVTPIGAAPAKPRLVGFERGRP